MMKHTQWLPVVVNIDGCVIIGRNKTCIGEVVQNGDYIYTLRETTRAGRHIVVHQENGEYLYHTLCNKPGQYFLGDTYGYRRIPDDEEPCPVRRVLRKNKLPVGLVVPAVRGMPKVAEEHTYRPALAGNKYHMIITDGEKIPTNDDHTRVTIVKDFQYLVESGVDYKNIASPFIWVNQVSLVPDADYSALVSCADSLTVLMESNQHCSTETCSCNTYIHEGN